MRKRHLSLLLTVAAIPRTKAASSSNAVDKSFIDSLPECARKCLGTPNSNAELDILDDTDACSDPDAVKDAIYSCTGPDYCGDYKQENWDSLSAQIEANDACPQVVSSSSSTSSRSSTTRSSTSTTATTSSTSTSRLTSASSTPSSKEALKTSTPTASQSLLSDIHSTPIAIPSPSSKRLSTGAIAGIVVGSLAFLAILGALLFLIFRNRRHHRKQVQSMILEPNESSGPEDSWKPMTSTTGWVTVDSASSTPTFQPQAPSWPLQETYNTRSAASPPPSYSPAPATTRLAPLTITDNPPPGIAVVSPVSPPTAGFRPGIAEQLSTWPIPPPALNDEAMSPVSPVSTRKTSRDSHASSIISMDEFPTSEEYAAAERRHTCSAPAARLLNSDSRRISTGSTGSLARAESVAWRREVEEAAARATNRVVMNEQAAAQEARSNNERGSKGSTIPGLDRLTRKRWSKDSADSEFVVGTPPSQKPGGFLSGRKRVSDGSGRGVYIV